MNNVVAEGLLLKGQALSFDGYKLVFDDWTYWVHFYVGAERGMGVVIFAFVMMLIALVVRFGFTRRQISAVISEGTTI